MNVFGCNEKLYFSWNFIIINNNKYKSRIYKNEKLIL